MPLTMPIALSRARHALLLPAAAIAVCCGVPAAHAGRPLSTDDAGAEPAGECHLESWHIEGDGGTHAWALSPACGVIEGLEIAFDAEQGYPRNQRGHASGVSLKWAPPSWTAGNWGFGLKLSSGRSHLRGEPTTAAGGLLAIASWQPADNWALHLNLGLTRYSRGDARHETPDAVALAWTPAPAWLLFGELTGHTREAPQQTVGLRWWAVPDRLGFDMTVGRQAATPGSGVATVGLGWYGWGL